MNTTIPSSVLGAALLHVSYLDLENLGCFKAAASYVWPQLRQPRSDLKAAHGLAQLALELKRCGDARLSRLRLQSAEVRQRSFLFSAFSLGLQVHLTTQRLQGAFGESALHVAAAGRGDAKSHF